MSQDFKVKCPYCKKEFFYYQSETRPFCSKRCRLIDLGNWLDESYKVPGPLVNQLEEQNNQEEE